MTRRSENVLLIGLGGVGYHLAKRLSQEAHVLTVIESNPDLIRQADGELDARLIQGDAMSFASWDEAATSKMDYLIAVTDNDAVNITATLIAHRAGVQHKIARVRSLELWKTDALLKPADLHLDLIVRPEELAAQEIVRLLKMQTGNVVIDLADGAMRMMATTIDERSYLAGSKLSDLSSDGGFDFRIVAITRGTQTIIPSGDDELQVHDQVFALFRKEDESQMVLLAGVHQESAHSVLIIGGGLVGARVAELLQNELPTKLLEQNAKWAESLSHRLSKTELLHGDGYDASILIQAGIHDVDTVVSATGDSEANIMVSALAKHLIQQGRRRETDGHASRTISLIKREEYVTIASAMGSDIVLNKKVMAADEILRYIRRDSMLSMAHLHGFDAEVVELVADQGAPITRAPLRDLGGMEEKIVIGAYWRAGAWTIAVGDTQIEAGDKVIGICLSKYLPDLERLLLH